MSTGRSSLRTSAIALMVFATIIAVTLIPFFITLHLAHQQDHRALVERTDAIKVNVNGLVSTERTAIRTLSSALQTAPPGLDAFKVNGNQLVQSGGFRYMALVNITDKQPTISESVGQPASTEPLADAQTVTALHILTAAQPFSTTGMLQHNGTRYIGFIYGPPVAPAGKALYGEIRIDTTNKATVAAILGSHSDIDAALYSGAINNDNLIVSTSSKLPFQNHVAVQSVTVGLSTWTLVAKERRPVADTLTQAVPWIVLGSGVVIALLAANLANGLIRRRDNALQLARERTKENLSILEAAREAFISMDTEGLITRWSTQAEQLFGWPASEVVGKRVSETIIPEPQRQAHEDGLLHFLGTGTGPVLNNRVELDALHMDGYILPVELSIWVASTDGRPTFSAIAHDITERRRAAENLASVTQQALQASQLKSEFLANMSHEIRTPMNGVIGMASLLLQSELTEGQREQATVVQKSAESLLTVINDILDFSKIEAGRLEIQQANFDIRAVVDEVIFLFSTMAVQKDIHLYATFEPNFPTIVHGDAGRVRQVLLNIIGNAVKFTAEGSVVVACAYRPDADGNRVSFEVTDTGIGIAPESRERLFESFVQVDMSSARRHEGTGLGLAISSRLVGLMHGEIGVRSEHGVGSTFWFSILVGTPAEESERPQPEPHSGLTSALPPNVLVVEDNAVNQRVAALTLEGLGCVVAIVSDGAAAVETTKHAQFDVIFMDCQMPGMDGYEATRLIRANEGPDDHRVIIAMTASAMEGDRDRALRAGMDDYLSKPVKLEHFVAVLTKWLGASRTKNVIRNAAVIPAEPILDVALLSPLRQRTQENPSVYAGIVTTFLNQATDLVEEIRVAEKSNDRPTMARAAHKLRGSSATVGAVIMARLCTDIEVIVADSRSAGLTDLIDGLGRSLNDVKRVFGEQIRQTSTPK